MKTSRLLLLMLLSSVMGGAIAITGFLVFQPSAPPQSLEEKQQVVFSKLEKEKNETPAAPNKAFVVPEGLNFITAAEKATPAVVHIQTTYNGAASSYGRNSFEDMYRDFFGGAPDGRKNSPSMSSGSGVIMTQDGYIATNNHVIEDASKIEVVLEDKRRYVAELVGTDPTTDLALIKISEKGLPFVPFGNSDEVKIGQWVLAVGNPFDLTSTVTAGIVSAKARNINILRSRDNLSIESFIQTDAAVNPGNSGGALIDLNGNLIGINTAIATTTGSYSGYSFAVPVTLVRKVMDDLLNYGEVQRALMGVSIQDLDARLAERLGIDKIEGVYVSGVANGGGADDAGIQRGDIIISVDGSKVSTVSELQEMVARNRPGDEIVVEIKRGAEYLKVEIELKNRMNNTEIMRTEQKQMAFNSEILGAEIRELTASEMRKRNIEWGLFVEKLNEEGKLKMAKVQEGFAITHLDKVPVKSLEQLEDLLKNRAGGALLEGVYEDGEKAFYGIGF